MMIENLMELTKLGIEMDFTKVITNINKIEKHFLPLKVQRNFKYVLAYFLYLYPMPKKKIKVYHRLTDKQKFSFLMKYLLSTLYKEKVDKYDINFYKDLKDSVRHNKSWTKYLKTNSNVTDINDEDYNWTQLKKGIKVEVSEAELEKNTQLLTKTTIKLMWQLINKRNFLIDNMNANRYL